MSEPRRSLSGVHVLLVEDDDDSRELIAAVLEYCGGLVSAAASARQALDLLRRTPVDVLVSDLSMPGEDGYWLLEQIRKLSPQEGGTLPALALTAHTWEHSRRRALLAGFQHFLSKPVEPWELCRVVASLLGRRAA